MFGDRKPLICTHRQYAADEAPQGLETKGKIICFLQNPWAKIKLLSPNKQGWGTPWYFGTLRTIPNPYLHQVIALCVNSSKNQDGPGVVMTPQGRRSYREPMMGERQRFLLQIRCRSIVQDILKKLRTFIKRASLVRRALVMFTAFCPV